MGPRLIVRLVSVGAVSLGAAVAAPAASATAAIAEPPPARAISAPWCGKTLWSGGKMPTTALLRNLERVEKVVDTIDIATDAATVVLMAVSGGVAVPAGVAKAVAKLGARMIIRVVRRLKSDVLKINKRRAGVRLKLKCAAGVVPYPSFGVFT